MARKTPGAGESDPTRWRREAERLRPLEDAHLTLKLDPVKMYLSTLGAVWHVAHHDVRRGGDGPMRPLETGSGGIKVGLAELFKAGYDAGSEGASEAGYQRGYERGTIAGARSGTEAGIRTGYEIGLDVGYGVGFTDGKRDALKNRAALAAATADAKKLGTTK